MVNYDEDEDDNERTTLLNPEQGRLLTNLIDYIFNYSVNIKNINTRRYFKDSSRRCTE